MLYLLFKILLIPTEIVSYAALFRIIEILFPSTSKFSCNTLRKEQEPKKRSFGFCHFNINKYIKFSKIFSQVNNEKNLR